MAENFMGYIGYFIKESEIEESGVCKRGTANKSHHWEELLQDGKMSLPCQ